MSEEPIVHFLNQRQPPLYGTLSTDSVTDPLPAGATVAFSMREVGSSTLKIDHVAATVTDEPGNIVRYDWAANDVNTAGFYVGWWTVTISGQTEDTPEFPVWIRTHAPVTNQYVSVADLKTSAQLIGESFADRAILRSIEAASNAIDSITGTTFALAASSTRLFTPVSDTYLIIGDVTSVTTVLVDGTAWVQGTDYYLDGNDTLRVLNGKLFTRAPQAVSVTANFGFAAVPPEITEAAEIIAAQLVKRKREAVFGVVATALTGEAIRIARFDPHVDMLLAKHTRSSMIE